MRASHSRMWQLLFYGIFSLSTSAIAQQNSSMSFKLNQASNNIQAYGIITESTSDEFRSFLKINGKLGQSWPITIVLNSNGGSVAAALEIGRLVRSHQMNVYVQDQCVSSCSYLAMGGINRIIAPSGKIGVHQFYSIKAASEPDLLQFSGRDLQRQQAVMGSLQQYVSEMGVDPEVLVIAAKTPYESMRYLSPLELQALRVSSVSQQTISVPTVPSSPASAPAEVKANPQELSLARKEHQIASAEVDKTRGMRFAGSCRIAGSLVTKITGRGTPFASGRSSNDRSSHVEHCGREYDIQSSEDSRTLVLYRSCVSKWTLTHNIYNANCLNGELSYNELRNYKMFFSRKNNDESNTSYSINGLNIRAKDLKENTFIDGSCAGMLENVALNYMALCDMSPNGIKTWSRFE